MCVLEKDCVTRKCRGREIGRGRGVVEGVGGIVEVVENALPRLRHMARCTHDSSTGQDDNYASHAIRNGTGSYRHIKKLIISVRWSRADQRATVVTSRCT